MLESAICSLEISSVNDDFKIVVRPSAKFPLQKRPFYVFQERKNGPQQRRYILLDSVNSTNLVQF